MRVGAADVESVPRPNGLDNADVVAAVEALRLALGHTGGHVAGLQQQAVVVAAGGAHVAQVHPDDPVHGADIERIPRLVQVESSGNQESFVHLQCITGTYLKEKLGIYYGTVGYCTVNVQ